MITSANRKVSGYFRINITFIISIYWTIFPPFKSWDCYWGGLFHRGCGGLYVVESVVIPGGEWVRILYNKGSCNIIIRKKILVNINIMSDFLIESFKLVEKDNLLFLKFFKTSSSKPGSYIGIFPCLS